MLEQLVRDSQALDRAIAGEELSYKDGIDLMNYDNIESGVSLNRKNSYSNAA